MSLSTKSVVSALALVERLRKLADNGDRSTIKHIAADLEVQLAKIKKEREFLINENQALRQSNS